MRRKVRNVFPVTYSNRCTFSVVWLIIYCKIVVRFSKFSKRMFLFNVDKATFGTLILFFRNKQVVGKYQPKYFQFKS